MGAAALDFYPATAAFSMKTPSKTHPWASALHTLVLRDSQWHLASGSANQSEGQNTSRALRNYTCIRASPFDFWISQWSELFTQLLPISVCMIETAPHPDSLSHPCPQTDTHLGGKRDPYPPPLTRLAGVQGSTTNSGSPDGPPETVSLHSAPSPICSAQLSFAQAMGLRKGEQVER